MEISDISENPIVNDRLLLALKKGPEQLIREIPEVRHGTNIAQISYETEKNFYPETLLPGPYITDVRFSQGNSSINLKTLLPGKYRILHCNPKRGGTPIAEYKAYSDSVWISPEEHFPSKEDYYLALFHESGHAEDGMLDVNPSLRRQLYVTQLRIHIASILSLGKGNEKEITESLEYLQSQLRKRDMGERDLGVWSHYNPRKDASIVEPQYVRSLAYLKTVGDDERNKYLTSQKQRLLMLLTKLRVNQERNAWTLALDAVRISHENGIYLYSQGTEELFKHVDNILNTFESHPRFHLTEKTRFRLFENKP